MNSFPTCSSIKTLPPDLQFLAARKAIEINPHNQPFGIMGLSATMAEYIAVKTAKRWRTMGVRLTVGFLDNPPSDLRKRILLHMNAWNKKANVQFVEAKTDPEVRISRSSSPPDDGYWSYLGTDILSVPGDQPTMNLQEFTMNTPESEFIRVVRHEAGHTLGLVHEHMRRELVNRIDPKKAIRFFRLTQGWDEAMTRAQVLTPIEDSLIYGTSHADSTSIMCYQIPGTITIDGNPIIGGVDINDSDYEFVGKIYPKQRAVLQLDAEVSEAGLVHV